MWICACADRSSWQKAIHDGCIRRDTGTIGIDKSNTMLTIKPQQPTWQPEWPQGTHLVTPRFGYLHHGIYSGDGKVLHYAGLCEWWHIGPVEEVSLECFSSGRPVSVREHPRAKYRGKKAVARARSRLGEKRYSLFNNNCEHLCTWSIYGVGYSEQVAALLMTPASILQRLVVVLRTALAKTHRLPISNLALRSGIPSGLIQK